LREFAFLRVKRPPFKGFRPTPPSGKKTPKRVLLALRSSPLFKYYSPALYVGCPHIKDRGDPPPASPLPFSPSRVALGSFSESHSAPTPSRSRLLLRVALGSFSESHSAPTSSRSRLLLRVALRSYFESLSAPSLSHSPLLLLLVVGWVARGRMPRDTQVVGGRANNSEHALPPYSSPQLELVCLSQTPPRS
jgi:hypothetical protein